MEGIFPFKSISNKSQLPNHSKLTWHYKIMSMNAWLNTVKKTTFWGIAMSNLKQDFQKLGHQKLIMETL